MKFTNTAKIVKSKSIRLKDFIWGAPYIGNNKTNLKFQFRLILNPIFRHFCKPNLSLLVYILYTNFYSVHSIFSLPLRRFFSTGPIGKDFHSISKR